MAQTFQCAIITPDEKVFDDEVTYASFPAWDGQHGVMTGQSPMLCEMGVGALRLDFPAGGRRWYLLDGGFAQVEDGALTLLTDQATPAETLSLDEAQREMIEASARVLEPGVDLESVVRQQQRALAKQAMARAADQRGGAI